MLESITPVVLTRDEEPNIGRTLAQLAWARDVVLVDSFSTDRTVEIARTFPNVRVIQRAFDTHAAQWSFAIEQASTEWVLMLDADHFVPELFVQELALLEPPEDVNAYGAPFRWAERGRLLRATLYPPHIVLARRGAFEVWQDGHTQRIRTTGVLGHIHEPLIHDDQKDFRRFLGRQRIYMRQEAEKIRKSSFRALPFSGRVRKLRLVAPLASLGHTLFVRRLILDGRAGWRYAFERFVAESMLSAELWKGTSGRLVRLPLRLVPRKATMRILSGELRGWRWIAGAATHGCWLGTYEKRTQGLFQSLIRPGDVVLDVGANTGFYTLLASKLTGASGHVYAFEPMPRNIDYLERHVKLNAVHNVTVLSLAAAANSGKARFRFGANASMGGLANDGELEVPTASLDDLLAAGRISIPNFIKMDIEGGETDALRGASAVLAARTATIVLSAHGYVQHEQCSEILRRAGYHIELLRDGAEDGDYLLLAKPDSPLTPARSSDRP